MEEPDAVQIIADAYRLPGLGKRFSIPFYEEDPLARPSVNDTDCRIV